MNLYRIIAFILSFKNTFFYDNKDIHLMILKRNVYIVFSRNEDISMMSAIIL